MSRRTSEHTLEERIAAVYQVIDDGYSLNSVASEYGIDYATLKSWIRKYKADGIDGLKESTTWKRYSYTLKVNAIQDYLSGKFSLEDCCKKYGISGHSVLSRWIKKYTEGEAYISPSKGRSTMNKGRKTTYTERIEIAQYTLAHDKNYQQAADHYQVSYQQVYSWVQKYLKDGENGLQDRCGKSALSKPEETLTEEERLRLRIQELEQVNAYQATEIALLKKLRSIKRRWR